MSTDAKNDSLRELYLQAIRLEGDAERESFLDEACQNHPGMRIRLAELLAARRGDQAEVLLEKAAANMEIDKDLLGSDGFLGSGDQSPDQTHDLEGRLKSGSTLRIAECMPSIDVSNHPMIGHFKLLEEIGQGGMGTVYMAKQTEPVKRQVALKIIKPGMDTREVIARFEAERQALAMMDHPNIAKVFDGGTTDQGRPYFVMELVRGVTITEFCKQKKLSLRDRLELFVDICKAVQHAHQKGIIHRDLKPSNLLVTMHDHIPVIKVIDFGVAKALNQELTDKTLFTQFSQMIGTPLYMAPEQAQMSGLDIDTRSDIYSLGVILYELLTGTTPFDRDTMSKLGADGLRKLLNEQDPERPSHRISTLKVQNQATVEDQRQLDGKEVAKQLNREVDWIVMKALEKDRERRYETANAFAADVQRFLNDEPVEACPPSKAYMLRKRVRKHRSALLTLSAVALALFIGSGLSLWQARVANIERDKANTQQELASASFDKSLEAVDSLLERVASKSLASTPELTQVRRKLYDDAIRFYEELGGMRPDDVRVQIRKASAQSLAALLCNVQNDFAAAREYLQDAEEVLRSLHNADSDDRSIRIKLAECLNFKGDMLTRTNYTSDAIEAKSEAVGLLDPDLEPQKYYWRLNSLCDSLRGTDRREEALTMLLAAMPAIEQIYESGYSDPKTWNLAEAAYRTLCSLHVGRKEYQEAILAANKSIEISNRYLSQDASRPDSLNNLRMMLASSGKIYERLNEFETALNKFEASLSVSTEFIRKYPTMNNESHAGNSARGIARMLIKLDRKQELESRLQEVQPRTGMDYYIRSQMFKELGEESKMIESLKHAIALDDTLDAVSLLSSAGVFCAIKGLDSEAEKLFSQGIDLAKRLDKESLGRTYAPFYYGVLNKLVLGDIDSAANTVAEMIRLLGDSNHPTTQHFIVWSASLAPGLVDDYQALVSLARRGVGNDPDNQQYSNGFGAILMRAGKYDEAIGHLQKASAVGEDGSTSSSYTRYFQAMTEHHLGNSDAAVDLLDQANKSSDQELADSPAWNRRLTLELLRREAESLIQSQPATSDGN